MPARSARAADRRTGSLIWGAMVLLALSTFFLARAWLMPAEVRRERAVYAYDQALGYDFRARVQVGQVYHQPWQGAADLVRIRLPQDPPAYRHVLVGRYVEAVELKILYRFTADRARDQAARLKVDSMLVVPRLWQESFPLSMEKKLTPRGRAWSGEVTLKVPVADIARRLRAVREEAGINPDQAELRVRSVFEVQAPGKAPGEPPVTARLAPEYVLVFRNGGVLELDAPRTFQERRAVKTATVQPRQVRVLGAAVPVPAWRFLWLAAEVASLLALGASLTRRREREVRTQHMLARLGPGLVAATSFTPPPGLALADLASLEELVHLHWQTERPIIQVGGHYYLADEHVCYRVEGEP